MTFYRYSNKIKAVVTVLVILLLALGGCRQKSGKDTALILLFNGIGTSPNDVIAIQDLLEDNNLDYATVNSTELNNMSEADIHNHRLLIFPGGNFIDMGMGLTPGATTNVCNAVHQGLNYLGICAGGFLAGDSPYYNSLKLTPGIKFGFYSAEAKGIRKAVVPITSPGSLTTEHYWEDGPQFTGWGQVIGKYPDSTPAVVQGTFGKGWVVLAGVHPEAPDSWRNGMAFNTTAETDNAYAVTLIKSALKQVPLSHF